MSILLQPRSGIIAERIGQFIVVANDDFEIIAIGTVNGNDVKLLSGGGWRRTTLGLDPRRRAPVRRIRRR